MIFYTYFNVAYLAKGKLMLESLLSVAPTAKVFVYAMDPKTNEYLQSWKQNRVNIVNFENEILPLPEIAEIRKTREGKSFFWSLTPILAEETLKRVSENAAITYIDADLYFYSNPAPLLEGENWDCLISPHFYGPSCQPLEVTHGKYCVQFMSFRNNANGKSILRWWKEQVLESCEPVPKNGKFGDQKYVDEFQSRFERVTEIEHPGAGLASWNLDRILVVADNRALRVVDNFRKELEPQPLVFAHFHGMKVYGINKVRLIDEDSPLPEAAKKFVYTPYARKLLRLSSTLATLGLMPNPENFWIEQKRILKRIRRESSGSLSYAWQLLKRHWNTSL